MDLSFSDAERAFRDEVRNFLAAALPRDLRQKMIERRHLGKDDIVRWQRILNARGWAVPGWPVEWADKIGARRSAIFFRRRWRSPTRRKARLSTLT